MSFYKEPVGSIVIKGLKVFGHHGVDPQETLVGNMFEVSVSLRFVCEHAMRTDRLDLTINYAEVVALIREEMEFPSKLLEHVALRIYDHLIRRFPQITGGTLEIYKLQPPISAELDRVGFCFEW